MLILPYPTDYDFCETFNLIYLIIIFLYNVWDFFLSLLVFISALFL